MIFRPRGLAGVFAAACVFAACDTHEPGIEVSIETTAEAPSSAGSSSCMTVTAIELLECPAPVTEFLETLLVSRAYAHTRTSPTLLAVEHMIDPAKTGAEPRLIGVLRPPPGEYCGLNISFSTPTAMEVEVDFPERLVLDGEHKAATVAYRVDPDIALHAEFSRAQ